MTLFLLLKHWNFKFLLYYLAFLSFLRLSNMLSHVITQITFQQLPNSVRLADFAKQCKVDRFCHRWATVGPPMDFVCIISSLPPLGQQWLSNQSSCLLNLPPVGQQSFLFKKAVSNNKGLSIRTLIHHCLCTTDYITGHVTYDWFP